MKQFVNRATTIDSVDEDGKEIIFGFANLAILCLNLPPQGGWSTEEMEERLPITKKLKDILKTPGATIDLEDSEVRKIARQVEAMNGKWTFMHEDVLSFTKYVKALNEESEESGEPAP